MTTNQILWEPVSRFTKVLLALTTGVALIGGCGKMGYANAERVVKVENGQLTVAEEDGTEPRTRRVAPDAEITLDGQPATLTELQNGDAVKVTIELQQGSEVVKKIEARSKENVSPDKPADPITEPPVLPPGPLAVQRMSGRETNPAGTSGAATLSSLTPAEGLTASPAESWISGTITSISDGRLRVVDGDQMEHSFKVNEQTMYTLDGNEATFNQLKVDFAVRVSAGTEKDVNMARVVDASKPR